MSDELEAAIEAAAAGPRKVKSDQLEAESHPLPDLIKAADRVAGAAAATSKTRGVYLNKLNMGGAV